MRALSRDVWEAMIRTVEHTAETASGRGVLIQKGKQKAAFRKRGMLMEASHGTNASSLYTTS